MADVARAAGVSLGTVSNVLNNPARVAPETRQKVEAAIAELGFVRNGASQRSSPGMVDVARAAGVSLGTVSNVLNDPAKVTAETRRKVEAAIAELGFVRNGAARSLKSGTSSTLGFVVQDLSNTFFLDMVRGAEEEAALSGMNVLLANSASDGAKQQAYLNLFEQEQVAGILVAPHRRTLDQIRALQARGMPLVVLNDPSPGLDVCAVMTDNVRGGYLAARHLIDSGRRRLLFAGPQQFRVIGERLEGAARAVCEAGAAVTLERVDTPEVRAEDGRRVAEEILGRPEADRPDAVLGAADLLALGVIQHVLLDGRLRIPEHLAVVGYDNNRSAWNSVVPITTLDQAGEEMGRTAARLLLEQLTSPRRQEHRAVTLEPVLIPRESTVGR
ncbi:LacI family DNA-binding transcriptional regulator [Blastococcus montanus]|uniref:LacI family DNA-binding transcriptional regulator n=1 Tax=Blastococcus montanus TaxID=3144973 RepID=UPI00320B92F1